MDHPAIEVFAYQETLLMMALFGIAILAMIWVGFRRWLQYKERMGRLTAEQTVEYGAQMERIDVRLKAIERMMSEEGGKIAAPRTNALSDPISKPDEI